MNPEPSNAAGSEESQPPQPKFIFSGVPIHSPLEELQAVLDKKLRTFQNLGEGAKEELYRRAFEIARCRLASILNEET
ncbi:MAG: hypothetical protein HY717_15755 [Planctomycetes bacterium]|nr:hypothetical protein [Planctomycetota bacterium]